MLVIRRRTNQSIRMGAHIEVKVLEIGPAWVKLGILAPPEVSVLRHEVVLTSRENATAADWLARGALPAWIREMRKKLKLPPGPSI